MIDTSKSYKSLSNREKGKILENLVSNTLLDFSDLGYEILNNIQKSRGDTDHLIINHLRKLLYIIETKNVNNDFRLYTSWFKSHVIERFINLPSIVSDYRKKGYQVKRVLIISRFTVADEAVHNLIKKYSIEVIEVGKQLLKQSKKWASLIKIKLKCLLKLGNNNKLIKDCNGLKNNSFDSNMTGIDLKSFKFSNYLKRLGSICSRFHSAISICISALPAKMKSLVTISLLKEKISRFISNNKGTLTIIPIDNKDYSEKHEEKIVTNCSLLDFIPKEHIERKAESEKSNTESNNPHIDEDILYLLLTLQHQNPKDKEKNVTRSQQTTLVSYLDSNSRKKKRKQRKHSKNMNYYEFKFSDHNLIIPLPKTRVNRDKLLYAMKDLQDGIRKEKIPEPFGIPTGSCLECNKYRKDNNGLYVCDIIHYLYLAYVIYAYIKNTEEAHKAAKAWAYHRIRQHNCVKKREAYIEYLDRMGSF